MIHLQLCRFTFTSVVDDVLPPLQDLINICTTLETAISSVLHNHYNNINLWRTFLIFLSDSLLCSGEINIFSVLCSFLSNDIICHVIQEDVWWESSDRGLSGHSVGGYCVHSGAEGKHQVG